MTVIEITTRSEEFSNRQRWNHYLTLIFVALTLLIAVNLRDSTLTATTLYINSQAGIRAEYPANWLIDTDGSYIFRVRDVAQIGFKTTIQVEVRPVSSSTSPRNVLDALSLNRAQTLAAYSVLAREPFLLPNEEEATSMIYAFVATDPNPFLESLPVVVEGTDILTIKRGQAIIISFLSDSTTYEENYIFFERFISSLEF